MKIYCNICNKNGKVKKLKLYIKKKTLSHSIIYSKCGHEYEKKANQLKYKKVLVLI